MFMCYQSNTPPRVFGVLFLLVRKCGNHMCKHFHIFFQQNALLHNYTIQYFSVFIAFKCKFVARKIRVLDQKSRQQKSRFYYVTRKGVIFR
jgi:hypothetical protein